MLHRVAARAADDAGHRYQHWGQQRLDTLTWWHDDVINRAEEFSAWFFLVKEPAFGRDIAAVRARLGAVVNTSDVVHADWSRFTALSTKCAAAFQRASA